MTSTPLVSVCIPTYRGAKYLGSAIESVLAQTFDDFELIVIDDNSPDNTTQVVARYSDSRIRYLRNNQNLGPEGNWNRCLQEAKGQYFKLLPQDDLIAPECLARQVRALEQPMALGCPFVFCNRIIIDEQGCQRMSRRLPDSGSGRMAGDRLIRSCLRHGTNLIGEPGAVLIRRKAIAATGTFSADCPYVIDLDYWIRLLAQGDAYYLDESLAFFRLSSDSWSVAIGARQRHDFQNFIRKLAANPNCPANATDILAGHVMAYINNWLRRLVYKIILRRKPLHHNAAC